MTTFALADPALLERYLRASSICINSGICRSRSTRSCWSQRSLAIACSVVLESGYYWQQFPALECAVFVPPRAILGLRDLDAVRRILRSENAGSATVQ